ncbi:MAG: PstS family phosphate ABC transporter substrate-binding protein [Nitrosomonadales bacterium]|nr:PstS family phosphate ABC transporter substrate-binding protein [Nitrosomonadales bacterium]
MPFSSKWLSAIALAAAVTAISACSSDRAETYIVRIDGSSTVFPITEAIAEEFQVATKIKTTVGISGTGGGFKKFCRGETDMTQASRPILKEEMEACKAAGIEYIELPIAYDALTVVINKNNDFITSMTVDELKAMWEPAAQDKIKNWNQVNQAWTDRPLNLFGAGSDSGTFDYFTEAIMGKAKSSRGDFTASEDDNVVVRGVAGDVGAIGYFGFAYFAENQEAIKAVSIVAKPGEAAVAPSEENVMNGTYQPLSRPLFIYVNAKSAETPEVSDFIDYYIENSKELIQEVKFIPLPDNEYTAVTEHWQARKVGTGFGGHPEVGIKIEDLLKRI